VHRWRMPAGRLALDPAVRRWESSARFCPSSARDISMSDLNEWTPRERLAGWTPRERPARAAIEGRYVRLEPLDPQRHGDGLYAASRTADADDRFRYLFEETPDDRAAFQ